MRTLSLLLLLLLASSCSTASRTGRFSYLNDRDTVRPRDVKLIANLGQNRVAYSTGDSLWITQANKRLAVLQLPSITSLLPIGDTLAIGTRKGYYSLTLSSMTLSPHELPARNPRPQINAFTLDKNNNLWIATEGFGLFEFVGTQIRTIATAPYMSSLAVTPDSGVWAGSNMGLFRIFKNGEIKRYYEETSNGISIPDNIIEHMQTDARGNLWVFASKAVTILRPEDYRGLSATGIDRDIDPVNYAFLGTEGNTITKFFQRKGHHEIWWALSSEGLLALSRLDVESEQPDGMPDIPQPPKGHLEAVRAFRDHAGKTLVQFSKPNDITFDEEGNLWLATDDGIWQITSETLDNFELKFLAFK